MSETLSTIQGILKEAYVGQKVENLIYDENPFLAEVPKEEDFYGKAYPIPLITTNADGLSTDFATAQTFSNSASGAASEFLVTNTNVSLYGVASWSTQAMLMSDDKVGAFIKAAEMQIDDVLRGLGVGLAAALYRDGYGGWAQVDPSTNLGSTVLQLKHPTDVVYFSTNRGIDVASTNGASSTARAGGSSANNLICTSIDRNLGTLTFNYNLNDATNGIPTIAANDFVFLKGNLIVNRSVPVGLEAWCPAAPPLSSDSFFSVNRSTGDVQRLSGLRMNGANAGSIRQTLKRAATLVSVAGGKLNRFYMHPLQFAQLDSELEGTRVVTTERSVGSGDLSVSFSGFEVMGPSGPIEVYADRSCPVDRIWGVNINSLMLLSPGKAVRCIDMDGVPFLRKATSDGFEARYVSFAQLACRRPVDLINIQMPAIT